MRSALITIGCFFLVVGLLWNSNIFFASTKYTPIVDIGGSFWGGGWGVVAMWRDNTGFAFGYDGNLGWRFVRKNIPA